MYRFVAAALLGMLCAPALADQVTFSASDTVRLGSRVIQAGDTRARVLDTGQKPLFVLKLNSKTLAGKTPPERHYFRNGNGLCTVVQIEPDGKVSAVGDVIGKIDFDALRTRLEKIQLRENQLHAMHNKND